MLFYLGIVTTASIFGGMASMEKKRKILSVFFMILAGAVLFLPLAMRGMGVDYINYQAQYNWITSSTWSTYWNKYTGNPEPLYVVLNFLANQLFQSYQGVNIFCALIGIAATCVGIYQYRNYINIGLSVWCFGFLLYIFMYGLNRLMIAVPLVMLSYKYLVKKNFFKYCMVIAVAGLFHYSAFLMIPFYFVIKWMDLEKMLIKGTKKIKIVCGVSVALGFVYFMAPKIFGGFSWFARYKGYFELEFRRTAIYTNAPVIVVLIVFFFLRKPISKWWENNKSIVSMTRLIVVLIAICLFFQIHRIIYLLYPCIVLLCGSIPKILKTRYQQMNIVIAFYSVMILLGVCWIYYETVVEPQWAPFINPYILGGI